MSGARRPEQRARRDGRAIGARAHQREELIGVTQRIGELAHRGRAPAAAGAADGEALTGGKRTAGGAARGAAVAGASGRLGGRVIESRALGACRALMGARLALAAKMTAMISLSARALAQFAYRLASRDF
jgi:hypothetical protein